jgi:hypothetical protein
MWQDWVAHAVDEFEHTTPCHCARSPASSSSSLLLLLLLHGLCSNSPVEALVLKFHSEPKAALSSLQVHEAPRVDV